MYAQVGELQSLDRRALITLELGFYVLAEFPTRKVVSKWSPDLKVSWTQNSRTTNHQNVEHLVALSIHLPKSHTRCHTCESRTPLVHLESLIVQGVRCSTGQRNRASEEENWKSWTRNDTPPHCVWNLIWQASSRSRDCCQIPGPSRPIMPKSTKSTGTIQISVNYSMPRSPHLACRGAPKCSLMVQKIIDSQADHRFPVLR